MIGENRIFAVILNENQRLCGHVAVALSGRQINLFWVYVWTLVFIAALIVSLIYATPLCTVGGFCMAWLSLTGMKFAVTEKCQGKMNGIRTIPEN